MMKKLMFAALAGASMIAVAPAGATVFNLGSYNGVPVQVALYGNPNTADNPFTDYHNFTLTSNTVMTSSGVQTTRLRNPLSGVTLSNLDFTSIQLYRGNVTAQSGTGLGSLVSSFTLTPEDAAGQETGTLSTLMLAAGDYSIRVIGATTVAPAAYNGTLNLAAVPEPATWGMMLLGFGLIGAAARRSRKITTVLA